MHADLEVKRNFSSTSAVNVSIRAMDSITTHPVRLHRPIVPQREALKIRGFAKTAIVQLPLRRPEVVLQSSFTPRTSTSYNQIRYKVPKLNQSNSAHDLSPLRATVVLHGTASLIVPGRSIPRCHQLVKLPCCVTSHETSSRPAVGTAQFPPTKDVTGKTWHTRAV